MANYNNQSSQKAQSSVSSKRYQPLVSNKTSQPTTSSQNVYNETQARNLNRVSFKIEKSKKKAHKWNVGNLPKQKANAVAKKHCKCLFSELRKHQDHYYKTIEENPQEEFAPNQADIDISELSIYVHSFVRYLITGIVVPPPPTLSRNNSLIATTIAACGFKKFEK